MSLLSAASSANAAGAIEPSKVDTLKNLALDLGRQANTLETPADQAAAPQLSVYLGVASQRLKVTGATVAIDDDTFVNSRFSVEDESGFATGGFAELARLNPGKGAHRISIRIDLQGRDGQPPSNSIYSGVIEESAAPQSLVLQLDQTLLLGTTLHAVTWSPESADTSHSVLDAIPLLGNDAQQTFVPGGANDPLVQAAAFLRGAHRAFDALNELQQAIPASADEPQSAWWREFAESAISFGALARASAALERLTYADTKFSSLAVLRIHLAEALYREGRYDEAREQLSRAKHNGVPAENELDWLDASSQIALVQGDYEEANRLLFGAKHELRYEDYVRYFNLGAALIRSGQTAKGATVLDRVGNLLSTSPLRVVVRDEANLELGYYFLRQQQGRTALPILNRVSLHGPQSTRALLGVGWAWLALPGDVQHRVELGDEREQGIPPESRGLHVPYPNDQNLYQRYRISPFERASMPGDERTRLQRALVVWSELSQRDHEDPAVQEGLAAIALARDRLGEHEAAIDALQQAVTALDLSRQHLIDAQQYVRDGRWLDAITPLDATSKPGSDWVMQDLPAPSAAIYLQALLADTRVQQHLHDYRDLKLLSLRLQDHADRLGLLDQTADVTALRHNISGYLFQFAAAQADQRTQLQTLAANDLQKQSDRNETLLTSARFRLARKFDSAVD